MHAFVFLANRLALIVPLRAAVYLFGFFAIGPILIRVMRKFPILNAILGGLLGTAALAVAIKALIFAIKIMPILFITAPMATLPNLIFGLGLTAGLLYYSIPLLKNSVSVLFPAIKNQFDFRVKERSAADLVGTNPEQSPPENGAPVTKNETDFTQKGPSTVHFAHKPPLGKIPAHPPYFVGAAKPSSKRPGQSHPG